MIGPDFRAEYDGSKCAACEESITRGEMVHFVDGYLAHAACDDALVPVDLGHLVPWKASIDFDDRDALQKLKLERPVCPNCYTELPKSMKCGVC